MKNLTYMAYNILLEQEESQHPVKDILADKGADIGIAAITAVAPGVMLILKSWLAQKGIIMP
ncbi:MAG: hypothetical protein LUK37_09285 [Clostridia bacterium]|nr:hypothetical protein [Clostridia bacterium]